MVYICYGFLSIKYKQLRASGRVVLQLKVISLFCAASLFKVSEFMVVGKQVSLFTLRGRGKKTQLSFTSTCTQPVRDPLICLWACYLQRCVWQPPPWRAVSTVKRLRCVCGIKHCRWLQVTFRLQSWVKDSFPHDWYVKDDILNI